MNGYAIRIVYFEFSGILKPEMAFLGIFDFTRSNVMKNVEKSRLRKISRLIMSFAVTLFFFGGTSVLAAGV